MARKARIAGIVIDPRTETMTAVALLCRGMLRHAWNFVPMGPRRRAELARLGQVEVIKRCDRCGTEETFLYDVLERMRVGRAKRVYPDGYLISREYAGSGRLSQGEAFVASLVRANVL